MEKKIIPALIRFKKIKIGAILVGFLCLQAAVLCADESVKRENALKEIAAIEGRGLVNFLTTPSEVFYTLKTEKKEHPKAWPLSYIPRFFTKAATRVGSSAYDMLVLPWFVRQSEDNTPLTRRFDLPDYAWQKE